MTLQAPCGPLGPPLPPGWVNIDAEQRWHPPRLQGGGRLQGTAVTVTVTAVTVGMLPEAPGPELDRALSLGREGGCGQRWGLWAEVGAEGRDAGCELGWGCSTCMGTRHFT